MYYKQRIISKINKLSLMCYKLIFSNLLQN